jgi:GAF domain-containing protein
MKYTEIQRLHALRGYNILDTGPEKVFDDITNIISRVCKTEIALISFVDENRQWLKSKIGIEVCETPRNISFCGHAIEEEEILVIEDTLQNEIFKNHPMVIGP